jgi:hypothetical protein
MNNRKDVTKTESQLKDGQAALLVHYQTPTPTGTKAMYSMARQKKKL